MKANRGLTVERMVELGRVSRSGFYRFDDNCQLQPDGDMELRDAIQRIALEWPSYGRPRITEELRRQGWAVNPKRVHRLLREDNLLCLRKRKFVVTTNFRFRTHNKLSSRIRRRTRFGFTTQPRRRSSLVIRGRP